MPKLPLAVPKYRHYRPKNLAVVNFGRGRDVYLGPWKSQRSRQLYDQLITLWLQHGRSLPDDVLANFGAGESSVHVHLSLTPPSAAPGPLHSPVTSPEPTITLWQLADQYNAHAAVYYRKHGRSTRESGAIKEALAVAVEMYGDEPVIEFGPLKFQLVRDAMVGKKWSRRYINKLCGRIKRAFRWGVTLELVPATVCGALREVEGLKSGRTTSPENEPVLPVDRSSVDATLKFLNPIVADMVHVHETAHRLLNSLRGLVTGWQADRFRGRQSARTAHRGCDDGRR